MKKIILMITLFFLLVGCSSKENHSELNHYELKDGNFSSIAGEYVNSKGEVVTINAKGLREGEKSMSKVYCEEGDSSDGYQMSIFPIGAEPDGGYMLTVYPIGIEVNEFVKTDTTKIRIGYGNGSPLDDEYIYTKK